MSSACFLCKECWRGLAEVCSGLQQCIERHNTQRAQFSRFLPRPANLFFRSQRYACGSTTDKRHIYFWLIGQQLSHLFVVAEFSVKASISQLRSETVWGPYNCITQYTDSWRPRCDFLSFIFILLYLFILFALNGHELKSVKLRDFIFLPC